MDKIFCHLKSQAFLCSSSLYPEIIGTLIKKGRG